MLGVRRWDKKVNVKVRYCLLSSLGAIVPLENQPNCNTEGFWKASPRVGFDFNKMLLLLLLSIKFSTQVFFFKMPKPLIF
jgi:hypothetical protein